MSARFTLRAAQADREGYYHTRWDQATTISVVADTQELALSKATSILGPARSGRYWAFVVDDIRECCKHEGADQ